MNLSNLSFSTNTLQRWLLVLLMGLAALMSYWVLEVTQNQLNIGQPAARTRPDYFVDQFNFVKIQAASQRSYFLVGQKLVHYPSDDHADITLPVLTSMGPGEPTVTARAKEGAITHITNQAQREVKLINDVVVDRPATPQSDHLQLYTDYLVAYPDKNELKTDKPVKIVSGDTVTTGVGLIANNITQHVEILKDVQSVIPPRSVAKNKP